MRTGAWRSDRVKLSTVLTVPKHTALSDPPRKKFVRLYNGLLAKGHSGWKVFSDFCEMSAMSLANAIVPCEAREAKYMEIVRRYSRSELATLCEMLGCVVQGLDHEVEGQLGENGKPAFPRCDFLGSLFMELELSNHWRGQFFTPYHLCEFMARMTFSPEEIREKVDQEGFVTVMEPASGAGAMIIAFASAMLEAGLNPQQHLHVTAIDVDATAAYMTFIQLSLLGIPASVYVGNTLTREMREVLDTPFHHVGLWDLKLHRRHERLGRDRARLPEDEAPAQGAMPSTSIDHTILTLDLATSSDAAPPPSTGTSPPRARAQAGFQQPDVTLPSHAQTDLFSTAA